MRLDAIRGALRHPGAQSLAIGAATVLLLIARRPDQLLHPEVWVEEGTVLFPDYLQHGLGTFLQPVSGCLVAATKLLFWIAIHLSFQHYALFSYLLTLVFSAAVALAIFRSPTLLPMKAAAALAPFLIPSDPEVHAVGLYIFWIVGLLSTLPLLWRLDGANQLARVGLVVLGGLSSPFGVALAPLYLVRALWRRTGADVAVLIAALAVAVVQVRVIAMSAFPYPPLRENLRPLMILEKFIGDFVLNIQGEELVSAIVGALLVGAMLLAAWYAARRGQWLILGLSLCCAAAIAASVLRAPVPIIDAHGNGPRYFFYPFVFLSWMLLAVWDAFPKWRRVVAGVLVVAFLNGLVEFSLFHADLDWPRTARACRAAQTGVFAFDIEYDGRADRLWKLELGADDCRRLSRGALFG